MKGPPFPGESAARVGTGRPGKGTGGECPAPRPPPRQLRVHARPPAGPLHPWLRSNPRTSPPPPGVPGLTFAGAARPADPGPFPPPGGSAPVPLSARNTRHPARAPSEAPGRPSLGSVGPGADPVLLPGLLAAGRLPPPSSAPQTPHPQASRGSLQVQPRPGPTARPCIPLLALPCSPSRPRPPGRPQESDRFFSIALPPFISRGTKLGSWMYYFFLQGVTGYPGRGCACSGRGER